MEGKEGNSQEEILKKNFEGNGISEENVETDTSVIKMVDESRQKIDESELSLASAGWTDINVSESPSEAKFMPRNSLVCIKSASSAEIKHYSTMDVNNPASVERHINEIMYKNCKVILGGNTIGDSRDLTHFDRLHYLFLVREKTMMNYNSERKLKQEVRNPNNISETKEIEISHKIFDYYKIKKGVMKWYNEFERCFILKDSGNGNDSAIELKFYVPTVGTIKWIKEYITSQEIRKRSGEDVFYDEFFMKVLQYIVEDWRLLENEDYFEKKQKWFNNLSLEEHDIVVQFIDAIEVGIRPSVKVKFGTEEVSVPIRFRDYKSIFSISDRAESLLSDDE